MSTFLSAPPPVDYEAPPPSRPIPLDYAATFRAQGHEREVWGAIMRSRLSLFERYRNRISPRYLEGFERLGLAGEDPPSVDQINTALQPLGWSASYVDGFIPGAVYAALVNNRIFPVANFLRPPGWIHHSPVPDYVHDVIGHLPQLFSRTLRDYMCRIAGVMAALPLSSDETLLYQATRKFSLLVLNNAPEAEVQAARATMDEAQALVTGKDTPLSKLGNLFLWTVELGVIGTPDDYRIVGAGLLSSESELRLILEGDVVFEPFNVQNATMTDIDFTGLQRRYFIARNFEDYEAALTDVCRQLGLPLV